MRGVVPVGYAVFAFVLGATVGVILQRSLPAMAVTLAVFAVQVAVPLWVRPHLSPRSPGSTWSPSRISAASSLHPKPACTSTCRSPDPGGWLISSTTVDPSGNAVETVPVSPSTTPACDHDQGVESCLAEIARLGYRQESRLHTSGQFWRLQAAEAALYAGLSAGLVGFCFWWLRRRAGLISRRSA